MVRYYKTQNVAFWIVSAIFALLGLVIFKLG